MTTSNQTTYLSKLSFSGLKGGDVMLDQAYNFNKNLVLILGENGTGKTVILQAIHLLLRGKVYRSTGMSSVANGKDIIKLAHPSAREICINGEWSDGVNITRVWKKSGSSVKESITQNIHPETTGVKEQQGLLNLHFGNLSEAWEPVEFFNLSSAKMRSKLMMSVQRRPIKDVMKMLPEEMPVWARPGSIEFPAEPWINSVLKDAETKIKEEQASLRHLKKKTELEPEFIPPDREMRLQKRLLEIQEEVARSMSSGSAKASYIEGRIDQINYELETLNNERKRLEIELEVAKAEAAEERENPVLVESLQAESRDIYVKLKDIGAARALAEEREDDLESMESSKNVVSQLKSFREKLYVAQNKLLVTAKKPFEESISKAVGKPCTISLKNNDCNIMVGGVDVSGLSDGENLRFIPGVVSALASNIESKWLPLPLDRFEAISKDKRTEFLFALKDIMKNGPVSQVFLAGCPDGIEEDVGWQIIRM